MAFRGRIPTDLVIYSRSPQSYWVDGHGNSYPRSTDGCEELKCRKAFAVDANSKSAQSRAERWAKARPLKARTNRLAHLVEWSRRIDYHRWGPVGHPNPAEDNRIVRAVTVVPFGDEPVDVPLHT